MRLIHFLMGIVFWFAAWMNDCLGYILNVHGHQVITAILIMIGLSFLVCAALKPTTKFKTT